MAPLGVNGPLTVVDQESLIDQSAGGWESDG
jgi:hypothetical protein